MCGKCEVIGEVGEHTAHQQVFDVGKHILNVEPGCVTFRFIQGVDGQNYLDSTSVDWMAKVYKEDEEYTKDHFCHGLDKSSSLCNCFSI